MTEEPSRSPDFDTDTDADPGQGLWQACVEQLAQDLPEQQFNTWIKPLVAQVAPDFSKVTLLVANRFKLDWIRAQYAGRITALLEGLYGQPVTLELALAQRESVTRTVVRPVVQQPAAPAETPIGSAPSDEPAAAPFRSRLNPALTFETLVEGTANRMARSAAMHVAGSPGHLYNPLFIYGGVGLGKTHLVHAVGNRLLQDKPDAKVLYIHAEQFVSDVVKAYQRRTFDEFKAHYHSLDLLLIDDVQFFANKDRTQEEFFNAFEALLAKKSHIVMTSDTYPKGLANIHERLVSRFDSGLTVTIEPPELEMRVAILINKARAESAEMPEEVAFFVAKNVRSNVRELEGALRKILAYSRFNQKESLHPARPRGCATCCPSRTGRSAWRTSRRPSPTTTRSRWRTCTARSAPPPSPGRARSPCTSPRSSRRRACRRSASCSGGRDHTTVLHAVRKIAGERQQLTELNQQLHVLEQTLKG